MRSIVLVLAGLFCSVAFAADNHEVTLFRPSYVGNAELRAGDYQLVLDGNHVVFMQGRRTRAEADVKVEAGGEVSARTRIRFADEGGKMRVVEIQLGGTGTRLVFN